MKSIFALLLVAAVAGCSQNIPVGTNPEPVNVTINVTLGGAPVDGLKFNFQPVGDGLPAIIDIKNGAASGPVTPGNYTWYVSGSEKDLTDKKIPEQYREGSMDRKVDIKGGETIEAKLD
ncbi:MAG: hypothetical protein ACKO3T_16820 [Planctomycetaceae bacterium]|jgi:hypothetical protein